jgi:hypothetical protein
VAAVRDRHRHLLAVATVVIGASVLSGWLSPAPAQAIGPGLIVGGGLLLGGILGGGGGKLGDALAGAGADLMKEILEFLIGDIQAVITVNTVRFLTEINVSLGPTMQQLTGPMIVIGGFFLVVGLITSIGDGYREVVAGTDTSARVMGQAIFRVIGLAVLLGSWFWVVPLAIDVANGLSGYLLDDRAMHGALAKSFRTGALLSVNPLFALLLAVTILMCTLVLLVLKFVIVIAFAILYLGGPALLGLAALPRIGALPLAIAVRGTLTLTFVPLVWGVVFAAWAGVAGGLTEDVRGAGDALQRVITGPALFLAGVVIVLGVTKRLLALSVMGTTLAVPGAGVLRSAVGYAVGRGVAQAAGVTAGAVATTTSQIGAATPPMKGAEVRSPSTQAASAGAAANPRGRTAFSRPLLTEPPRTEWEERTRHRAHTEEMERQEEARDRQSVATLRRGVWQEPRPRNAAEREAMRDGAHYEGMSDRVDELRTVWKDVPPERVVEAAADLPAGDRAGFAAAAKAALESQPSDRKRAWQEFRDSGLTQYAGRLVDNQRRDAIETLIASDPKVVWEGLRPEYERYMWREPLEGHTGGGYDAALFDQRGGLAEVRRRQSRESESGEGSLPF